MRKKTRFVERLDAKKKNQYRNIVFNDYGGYEGIIISEPRMKNHLYKVQLHLHCIRIHVSFPCTVQATLQIDNQVLELIKTSIPLSEASHSLDASLSFETSLLYNQRTSTYSVKKILVDFFLRTKSGRLQAGSHAFYLNKCLSGLDHETASISKCSDRTATLQYSLQCEFLEESSLNQSQMQYPFSQSQIHSPLNQSTLSFNNSKAPFYNSSLYESIVEPMNDNVDTWEKQSVNSNRSIGSGKGSLIHDLRNVQSSKILATRHNNIGSLRNSQIGGGFRNSRVGQQTYRNSQVNHQSLRNSHVEHSFKKPQNSGTFSHQKRGSQGRLRTSYLRSSQHYGTNDMQEDTKHVLQQKVQELERQKQELEREKGEFKGQLVEQKQLYEEELLKYKGEVTKGNIRMEKMEQELQLLRNKNGSLEKQIRNLLEQKNTFLIEYNQKEQSIFQEIKVRETTLTKQNTYLKDECKKLQSQLQAQKNSICTFEEKLRDTQKLQEKLKKLEYYQGEVVMLDQKLTQQKFLEEELRLQLERLKQILEKEKESRQNQISQHKKQIRDYREKSDQEKHNFASQIRSLDQKLAEKQQRLSHEQQELQKILSQKLTFQQKTQELRKEIQQLRCQLQKKENQFKQKEWQREEGQRSQMTEAFQERQIIANELQTLKHQLAILRESKEEETSRLEKQLQQFNLQQFRLNEENYELDQELRRLTELLAQKQHRQQELGARLAALRQQQQNETLSLLQAEQKVEVLSDRVSQYVKRQEELIRQQEIFKELTSRCLTELLQVTKKLQQEDTPFHQKNPYDYKKHQSNRYKTRNIQDQFSPRIQKRSSQAENLKGSLQKLLGQIKNLERQFERHEQRFTSKLHLSEVQNKQLESELKKLEQEKERVETEKAEAEKKLLETQALYEGQKQTLNLEINKELNEYRNQVIILEKDIYNKENQGKKVKQELLSAQQELKRIQSQFKKGQLEHNKEISALKKELQQLTRQLERKNNELQKAQQTLSDQCKRISTSSNLQLKLNQTQQQLIFLTRQIAEKNKTLTQQQEENSKNIQHIKELKGELLKKEQELKTLRKQIKLMEGKIFQYEKSQKSLSKSSFQRASESISQSVTSDWGTKSEVSLVNTSPSMQEGEGSMIKRKNAVLNSPLMRKPQPYKDQSKGISSDIKLNRLQNNQMNRISILESELASVKKELQEKVSQVQSLEKEIKAQQFDQSKNKSVSPTQKSSLRHLEQHKESEQRLPEGLLELLKNIQRAVQGPSGPLPPQKAHEVLSLANKVKKLLNDTVMYSQLRELTLAFNKFRAILLNNLKSDASKSLICNELKKIEDKIQELKGNRLE